MAEPNQNPQNKISESLQPAKRRRVDGGGGEGGRGEEEAAGSMAAGKQEMLGGQNRDPVIGLEVSDDRIFYTRLSTLTNYSGSYFAKCFGSESTCSPGDPWVDERGRNVYFVGRDGACFAWILKYLETGDLPGFPTFRENPHLWRQLRKELEYFYGLHGLEKILSVTYSCTPDMGDRGVLHWLGTNRGAADEYRNPFEIGAIHVGGSIDEKDNAFLESSHPRSRAVFVQYQPPVEEFGLFPGQPISYVTRLFHILNHEWCSGCQPGPVTIDLRSIRVRPTHFSLRYAECEGLNTDWTFEGSTDGANWDTLYKSEEGRNELPPLLEADEQRLRKAVEDMVFLDDRLAFAVSYLEQHHRKTWPLAPVPDAFYRYFRIVKVGEKCLHAVGLELFGDVYES